MHAQMQRLYLAAQELLGISQKTDLAKLLNISPQRLNNWEDRGISSDGMILAEVEIGCSAAWLKTGDGQPYLTQSNTTTGQRALGKVPLIDSANVGRWRYVVDNLRPGDAQQTMVDTTAPVMAHTYALRITGDSMEPELPEGFFVVVEPELEPQPGDYVIYELRAGISTLRQLVDEAGTRYLKPVNDRYPIMPLPENAVFCGVVRELVRRFR